MQNSRATGDASSLSFTFDTDSIVKKDGPAVKKNKEATTVKPSPFVGLRVWDLSSGHRHCRSLVRGPRCVIHMKGKSAKVAEAPSTSGRAQRCRQDQLLRGQKKQRVLQWGLRTICLRWAYLPSPKGPLNKTKKQGPNKKIRRKATDRLPHLFFRCTLRRLWTCQHRMWASAAELDVGSSFAS
jgi:hypothetical protein